MDSITRTAQSAVVSYYNALRRMGNVHRQDKYKLLVLWFFHWLKNRSDFLWKWDKEANEFRVDRELEKEVERRFKCNIPCLSGASCFIKLLPDDNCVPLLEVMWDDSHEDEDIYYRFLVTNATRVMQYDGQQDADDISEILENIPFTNGSAFIVPNEEDESDVNTFMTDNNNNNAE